MGFTFKRVLSVSGCAMSGLANQLMCSWYIIAHVVCSRFLRTCFCESICQFDTTNRSNICLAKIHAGENTGLRAQNGEW